MVLIFKETKSLFFENIKNFSNTFCKLIKRQKDNMQIIKISIEKGDIAIDTECMQTISRSDFRILYSRKLDNLNGFLDRYQLSKFNPDLKISK